MNPLTNRTSQIGDNVDSMRRNNLVFGVGPAGTGKTFLAYMRGRTLNDAFVILDEAQNTTREQMKMLLTRIGIGTWTVVTGDPSQRDLDGRERSGLNHATPPPAPAVRLVGHHELLPT